MNVFVRRVLPASFLTGDKNEDGSPMVVKDYMGFSWNPGVKRFKDWKELPDCRKPSLRPPQPANKSMNVSLFPFDLLISFYLIQLIQQHLHLKF